MACGTTRTTTRAIGDLAHSSNSQVRFGICQLALLHPDAAHGEPDWICLRPALCPRRRFLHLDRGRSPRRRHRLLLDLKGLCPILEERWRWLIFEQKCHCLLELKGQGLILEQKCHCLIIEQKCRRLLEQKDH
eukprot:759800-Rhodomonas_salina.2